jgi:Immunoglobulin I-set domain
LSCRATSGTPYPTITWARRDGKPLSSRFTEDYPGVITLREATVEDTGSYECRATNIAGTISLSTTLEVQQAPTLILEPDTQSIDLTEGDELFFTCAAVGIPQPTVIIKVPEGSNIRTFQRPAALNLGRAEASIRHSNIQRSQAGTFECVANNEAGQDTRYIIINVKEKRGDVGKCKSKTFRIIA